MAIFKCKMCGGALEINNNETVAVCEYCGTQQTLPKLDDNHKANLYDRANHFRRNNEFDKAMGIYEQILNDDNTDAESYWSLVLCRYGIEYVEDPANHKRIPTVNRAQFTSVFDDEDYKSALQYADGVQKSVYEDEAKAINEIQKGILAISQKEEPFDVFICYKETDSNGRRTQDSVIATELYHELTREGYKVFFSRITLEDKLGTAYEPYIFAALNSAKVMVVLGTKAEYFNAVWVKNEWSRYLSLIKNGAKKILIPAYRDMDPYDLPEEFSHLQAQDMTKLGFMQDLIRGINKLVKTETPQTTVVKETVVKESANGNVTSLLKRGFMALEDGEWNKADDFFEQALNFDAELAEAYLGKLMAELKVAYRDKLKDCAEPFNKSNNYQKAVRFGDDFLKKELSSYTEHIKTRNENTRLEVLYNEALTAESRAINSDDYLRVAGFFEKIIPFKDSQKHKEDNLKKANEQKAIEEQKEAERQKELKQKKEINDARNKKIRKKAIIVTVVLCVIAVIVLIFTTVIIPNNKYNEAITLMESGHLDEAETIFQKLGDYKDAVEKSKIVNLRKANVGDYIEFGTYKQNSVGTENKPVEWIVLEKQETKILVISKHVLDCQQYNTKKEDFTWETCSLRNWLNNDFVDKSFSEWEKGRIPTVTITTEDSTEYGTSGGNDTQDQIFVLSLSEARKYFSFDKAKCQPTEYAEIKGVYVKNSCSLWWLRSPGREQSDSTYVNYDGQKVTDGIEFESVYLVDSFEVGVRPAMWISIEG